MLPLFDLVLRIQGEMKEVVQSKGSELTPPQIAVLRALAGSKPMSLKALGERVRKHKSQVTRLVQGLERKGLVTRVRNPEDGRGVLVAPAPEVFDTIEKIFDAEGQLWERLIAGLDKEEVELVNRLLVRMGDNL